MERMYGANAAVLSTKKSSRDMYKEKTEMKESRDVSGLFVAGTNTAPRSPEATDDAPYYKSWKRIVPRRSKHYPGLL
jgi:hypothetical protein